MRVRASQAPEAAAYMTSVGVPEVIESLLSVVLKERPDTKQGMLEAMHRQLLQHLEPCDTPKPADTPPDPFCKPASLSPIPVPCPDDPQPVYRVVFTGGPCAGKTTGMSVVREKLESEGFNVLVTPEAATLLFNGGAAVAFHDVTDLRIMKFQLALLRTQLLFEQHLVDIAQSCGKPAVVLCDRGTMDGRAFCTPEVWDMILEDGGWTTEELRDARYDMVLHLVTAADGAEDYYTTENNQARSETAGQALEQDLKLREMWQGHPHRIIVRNSSTDFGEKMDTVCESIFQLVGVTGKRSTVMFELFAAPRSLPVAFTMSYVKTRIIKATREESQRLCTSWNEKGITHTKQTLRLDNEGRLLRTERVLSERSSSVLLDALGPHCEMWDTMRRTMTVDSRRLELVEHSDGRVHLYVEVTEEEDADCIELPSWIAECGTAPLGSSGTEALWMSPRNSKAPAKQHKRRHRPSEPLVGLDMHGIGLSCSAFDVELTTPTLKKYKQGTFVKKLR